MKLINSLKPCILYVGFLFISGCRCEVNNFSNYVIIREINPYDEQATICRYISNYGDVFLDTCGKFNVGDTVKIVKK